MIPTTWTLNLSLPQMLAEMTTLEAAAMARRPSTATSRAITTKATQTLTRSTAIRPSRAPTTSSLSAVVSRKFPSMVVCCQRRAR